MRFLHLGLIIVAAVFIFITSQFLLEVYLENELWKVFAPPTGHDYERLFKEVTQTVILWWAPIGGSGIPDAIRKCGQYTCYFTSDRQFHQHPQMKAVMFYGSNTNISNLPLPRRGSSVLWALLHEESPRNNGPLTYSPVLSLFNLTATFSRHSSYPLTTQYLSSLHSLTDMKYFVNMDDKKKLQQEKGLAPVVYIQSDCSTPTDRDSYVVELSRFIAVDSYGACLHNKDLPPHLQPPHSLDTMMSDELLHLVAQYKFALALENGVCHDYITEKLWRPLIAGSVPVYMGSPTISDWLPNNKSAVLVQYFASPKDLAEHLNHLNTHDEEYSSYIGHKLRGELSNTRLIQTMKSRQWGTEDNTEKNLVDGFACHVCEKAHDLGDVGITTTDHYSCPMPVSILSNAPNTSNFWLDLWFYNRCEAEVTRHFVDLGVDEIPYDKYHHAISQMVLDGKCNYNGRAID